MMACSLCTVFDTAAQNYGLNFYKDFVPGYIAANLKSSFTIRPYQQEAFGRFVFYWENYANRPKGVPVQLLYQMATGSGKTLIMAGLMLYLYQKGYRNFLFFVNSTNIIEKTKENFLNPLNSKYLFADTISFAGKLVQIRLTDNFQTASKDDINICFNTVQGLHSLLNTPRENSLTYNDFEYEKIVLISDEAHHINAETKKGKDLSTDDIENINSWEGTVTRIVNAYADNVMLEFTATADINNPLIAEKYQNKLLFNYPLRQFRIDGYSKEVQILQADLDPLERALQSVLLSQYRRKIFEKNGLHIKPVILMKSKTIKESQDFQEKFKTQIKNLNIDLLKRIKSISSKSVIKKVFDYCKTHHISLDNLIDELKEDFNEDRYISVNSKEDSIEKQIAINSLEDENNEFRVIFAVDKLNEGWDVLNLFDIVRLYDTHVSKYGTTMQEAQLIGRGARYCPFQIDDSQPLFMRKFDNEKDNELRICEELYYYSSHNPKYINELHTALIQTGIKASKTSQREFKQKECFLPTELQFKKEYSATKTILDDKNVKTENLNLKTKEIKLIDLGERIIRKALNKIDFYRFDNLQIYFPNLQSITEFITSENYLAKINVSVSELPAQIDVLTPHDKLSIAIKVLNKDYTDLNILSMTQ